MQSQLIHNVFGILFSFTIAFFIGFVVSDRKYVIIVGLIIAVILSFSLVYLLNLIITNYIFKDQHISHSTITIPTVSVFLTIIGYLFDSYKRVENKRFVSANINFPLVNSFLFTGVIVVIYGVIFILVFEGGYLSSLSFMYKVLFLNGLAIFLISLFFFNYIYKNHQERRKYIYWYYAFVVLFFIIKPFFLYNKLEAINIQNILSHIIVRLPFVIMIILSVQISYMLEVSRVEKEYLKQEKLVAQLNFKELKNQLSPHFLFNNINVLTSLIEENPKKAIRFSENLSNVYRRFLDQEKEDMISLKEELKFARDYLSLFQDRFEKGLNYDIEHVQYQGDYILSTSLQQVLENVIKHNILEEDNPINIFVSKEDDYLVIKNNCNLKSNVKKSPKKGLKNIQKRYMFFTEMEVVIDKDKDFFTVKLPLLKLAK